MSFKEVQFNSGWNNEWFPPSLPGQWDDLKGAVSLVNSDGVKRQSICHPFPYDLFSPVSETINQGDN